MGPILGAGFIVAAGDLTSYANEGHLASAAGLVPAPATPDAAPATFTGPSATADDFAESSTSAQTSIIREGPNRDYYLKKRSEGANHVQAVIALARRRVAVLWALLRDNRPLTPTPPQAPATA